MAQQKKNIPRLTIQGISILGILVGLYLFLDNIYTIFLIERDNLGGLSSLRLFEAGMLVLAAFLIYSSYLMLRGKSFGAIKTIAVLLALMSFSLVIRFGDLFINTDIEKSSAIESIFVSASFLVSVFVFMLIYIISVMLLERLKEAAYSPEKISETQNSTAQRKKTIARLALEGISIFGILLGITCLYITIDMIFPIQRDDLNELYFSLFSSVIGLLLAAFLTYPSYLMLRGKSFGILKSISALLALTLSVSVIQIAEDFITTLDSEKKVWSREPGVILAYLLVYVLVLVLVYRISVKLLERLKEVAYGPEIISEPQISMDKQ